MLPSYNTSTSPHESYSAVIQVPIVNLGGLSHQHEALRVRDNFRGVQSLPQILEELFLVALEHRIRTGQYRARLHAFILQRGQASGEYRFANQCDRHAVIQRGNRRPLAGALLASSVSDALEQVALLVLIFEYIPRDLDQERIQLALIPLVEHRAHLLLSELQTAAH